MNLAEQTVFSGYASRKSSPSIRKNGHKTDYVSRRTMFSSATEDSSSGRFSDA